ncbi:MAG: hypothetical protein DRJ41_04615 [Thermoprotei archaeon]|nr:MAG: hypothetical protein DRJ41_04615 [Thermoprotei archaeon]
MGNVRCSVCGSKEVMAKIEGKYYCFKCGSKVIKEHMDRVIEELKRKGLMTTE